jgi:hypothetical protein
MSSTPAFVATPKNPVTAFVNADGTTFKSLLTGAANGSRIDTLIASNTDTTAAYVLQLAIQKSGVDYVLGEVTVPIGSGTNGSTKSVALLNPTDIPGLVYTENGSIFLESGAILRARVKTAVGGSFTVQIVGVAGDA